MHLVKLILAGFLTASSTLAQQSPTDCGNQGIQWALYKNDQGPNTGGFYSDFSPEHFKTKAPIYQAIYSGVGGFNYNKKKASQISIYGSKRTFASTNFVLNHRFYFTPPHTGTYTVLFNRNDDIVLLWLRTNAYSGWVRTNDEADCVGAGACGSVNLPMELGQYYAFRVVYAQTKGAAGFSVTFTDENQVVVVDSNTSNSSNIVQFSCDGTAPMFEPFGAET